MNAPKVTPEMVEAEILAEDYYRPFFTITICTLQLRNGFNVTGESACVSPENFNEELGRKLARNKALDKIWMLLAFRMAEQRAQQEAQKNT